MGCCQSSSTKSANMGGRCSPAWGVQNQIGSYKEDEADTRHLLSPEVLPISQDLSTTAIRRRVRQMAQRLEDELGEEQDISMDGCQRDWDQLPDPAAPLIVGIDGGYISCKRSRVASRRMVRGDRG